MDEETNKSSYKKRNSLKREIKSRKEEWLRACEEVRHMVQEAKEERWKEVLEEAINEKDERKI